jgi:N-acetylglutamate synthase-like GNAT family acetyltransferase
MLGSHNQSSSLAHPRFRLAEMRDVAAIVEIINAAFRVERFFIGRDRTDADSVRTLMATGQFILAEDSERLAGCVYVELRKERGYFGLLSVDPARQKSGLGTGLIAAAENYFR